MRKYSHDQPTRHHSELVELYVAVRALAIENLIANGDMDKDFDPLFESLFVEMEIDRILTAIIESVQIALNLILDRVFKRVKRDRNLVVLLICVHEFSNASSEVGTLWYC